MKKLRVLILCHDVIGSSMAGPGIRYKYIASTLSDNFSVTLGIFSQDTSNTGSSDIAVINSEGDSFKKWFDNADVIFAQWLSNDMITYAQSAGRIVIFDLYAPVPIEYLASLEFSSKPTTKEQDAEFEAILDMYNRYLSVGQLFTCSNERQRDFWIGYLTANRILGPSNFKDANIFNRFVICPMGVDEKAPQPKKLLLRESVKGIKEDDFVLLWTGGIWDWFDAQVVIRAMALLKKESRIKLVFLGTRHPNKIYKDESFETKQARELAKNLKLVNKSVFFLDGWVPYDQRAAYFKDADAAIYADKESLETRFSHRTRVLDHFWTELPTICSRGDYMSSLIERQNLGIVVNERTPEEFAEAIQTLSDNSTTYEQIKVHLHEHRNDLVWSKTLEPLVDYLSRLDVSATKRAILARAHEEHTFPKPPPHGLKRRVRLSIKMLLLGK